MKRTVLLGILAGIGILIVGQVIAQIFGLFFPGFMNEYQNIQLFRPWSDPLMLLYFAHPFLVGIILAWFWNLIKKILTGKTVFKRALNFTLIYFVLATIPGMFITLSSFQVSFVMILEWTIGGFLQTLLAAFLFAKLNS